MADLRSDLEKITIPTAIFHGKFDKLCPFHLAEQLQNGIVNSKLISFEKSGHALFLEERDKFNDELITFITGKSLEKNYKPSASKEYVT